MGQGVARDESGVTRVARCGQRNQEWTRSGPEVGQGVARDESGVARCGQEEPGCYKGSPRG